MSMLYELADSRLVIPPPPPRHVARPRLIAALDRAMDVPLVLLSAGPGAGKTVLLAEWAHRWRGRVVWLCPTPDDDKPERFRVLLTSALGIGPDLVSPDGVGPAARPIDLVQRLRGHLTDGQTPLVLAIDDAHILTDPQILDLLDKIVGHGHPRLHLVLAARHDPPLPLHRYRLAGQMCELRAPDLAMTLGELHQVLAGHQVTLPMSALRTVAAQTEGWAAGVRLAAMQLEHASASAALAGATVEGEPSFGYGSIGEYFAAEVLRYLPEPHRRLLIETSFLDEVTAPLAKAITGLDGAGELLTDLARGNWFVTALDPGGTRFRYHRLFAAVLRDLLRRDSRHTMPELADRAAACFERAGDMEQALYWAARAGNPQRAAAMLVRGGLSHAFAHHNSIPEAELAGVLRMAAAERVVPGSHPEITLAAAAVRAATADSGAAARELTRTLDVVTADREPPETTRTTSALVELMLGMRAGDARAVDSAASRLTSRRSPAEFRGAVLLAQASARFWDGAFDDVDALLSEALAQTQPSGLARVQADVLGMMACVNSYRSRPRHADDAARQVHWLLRGQPARGQPVLRAPAALRLAAVIRSVQQADLAGAARTLRHAPVPPAVSADPALAEALILWRATVLALSGKPHEAHAILDQGSPGPSPALLQVHRDILLGEIQTCLGRPQEALRRFERHRKGRLGALADVPCARAYLALGDAVNARQVIRGVLSATGRPLSRYVLVEAMLLDARIALRTGRTGRALEMITNALDVAHEDLVLPFAQASDTFGDLLSRHPAVAARWPGPPPGARIAVAAPEQGVRVLAVQLTQREQSTLAYLATSMTTAEIAMEMYLSVNTVKTHLAAIYRKLGVPGRRDAVRRARDLELL
ncbi:MAG TPA: LuxR C-terminal-related transcriptional regulator [Trebonia sp.]